MSQSNKISHRLRHNYQWIGKQIHYSCSQIWRLTSITFALYILTNFQLNLNMLTPIARCFYFIFSQSFIYLWLAKLSSPWVHSAPTVANMIVVSKSAMIPLTALAALMQACVPREPDWSATRTEDTFTLTLLTWCCRSGHACIALGSPRLLQTFCTSFTQLLPMSCTVVRIRFAIYRDTGKNALT